jgi:hypothetical protein
VKGYPDRLVLERQLVNEHGVSPHYLGACSASTTYGEALQKGLISRAEYDAAATGYGRMWNYCGD